MRLGALFLPAAVSLLLAALPCVLHADEPTCSSSLLPEANTTEFPLLYSPRHDELTLEAGYVGSSLPFRSAFESTLMYNFAPSDEAWHLGPRVGLTAGRWGADERGPVGLTLGARVARDFWRPMSGVLGIYGLLQADAILIAEDGDPVLRPAVGVGVRAARAFGVELAFDPLFSLGGPFVGTTHFAGGFGVGVTFDFCWLGSWCEETAPVQNDADLTQRLYKDAQALSPSDPALHGVLCKAVATALDAARFPPGDPGDSTSAFLAGLATGVDDPSLRGKLDNLAREHATFRAILVDSRAKARCAAQKNRSLKDHCIYSPFPVEIRTWLGCDPKTP